MRLPTCLLLIALLWSGMPASVRAATPSGLRSLAGITAIHVAVEELNYATQKTGLRKEQVQAVVETYLTEHEIKLTGPGGGAPILYVRVSSVVGGEQAQAPISFYLTVQVKQFVHFPPTQNETAAQDSKSAAPLLVTTWEDGTMVMTNRAELGFYVRQVLLNVLGEFLQDYQDAKKGKA